MRQGEGLEAVKSHGETSTGFPRAKNTRKGDTVSSALDTQIGGDHYQTAIQPVEFIHANDLPYIEGRVVEYMARWRKKGGIETLRKARHYIEILIELEIAKDAVGP